MIYKHHVRIIRWFIVEDDINAAHVERVDHQRRRDVDVCTGRRCRRRRVVIAAAAANDEARKEFNRALTRINAPIQTSSYTHLNITNQTKETRIVIDSATFNQTHTCPEVRRRPPIQRSTLRRCLPQRAQPSKPDTATALRVRRARRRDRVDVSQATSGCDRSRRASDRRSHIDYRPSVHATVRATTSAHQVAHR